MEKSKKRITHIRNPSSLQYESEENDALSFDMVDSIIQESMTNSSVTQPRTICLIEPPKSCPGSSLENLQDMRKAEAKMKRLTKTQTFPLMAKTQKVLKQLKHNRKMPKPRAHLQSAIDSPEEESPAPPPVSQCKKVMRSEEVKVRKSLKNVTIAEPPSISEIKSKKGKVLEKNLDYKKPGQKQNKTDAVSQVQNKDVSKERSASMDSSSSDDDQFEKFVEKERRALSKSAMKKGIKKVSASSKAPKCSSNKNKNDFSSKKGGKDSQLNKKVTDSVKPKKDASSVPDKSKKNVLGTSGLVWDSENDVNKNCRASKVPNEFESTGINKAGKANSNCSIDSDHCIKDFDSCDGSIDSSDDDFCRADVSFTSASSKRATASSKAPMCNSKEGKRNSSSKKGEKESQSKKKLTDSVKPNKKGVSSVSKKSKKNVLNTCDSTQNSEKGVPSHSKNSAELPDELESIGANEADSCSNIDSDHFVGGNDSCVSIDTSDDEDFPEADKSTSAALRSTKLSENSNLGGSHTLDAVSPNSRTVCDKGLKHVLIEKTAFETESNKSSDVCPTQLTKISLSSNNEDSESLSDAKIRSRFCKSMPVNAGNVPVQLCSPKISSVVSLGHDSDSDDSDLEIIAIVNKNYNLSHTGSSPDDLSQITKLMEHNTNEMVNPENIPSSKSKFSSTALDSLHETNIKLESSLELEKPSIPVEKETVKQEIGEKHDPVYMTNMCQDFTQPYADNLPFPGSSGAGTDFFQSADEDSKSSKKPFLKQELVNTEDDDIIVIDPDFKSQKIKKELDDDIVIEFQGKVMPKQEAINNVQSNQCKKRNPPIANVDAVSGDYHSPAKVPKLDTSGIDLSLFEKALLPSSSNPLRFEPSSLIEDKDDIPELLDIYKKETKVYDDILQTEGNVVAGLKKLELHQAEKLKRIRSLIRERVERDPNYEKTLEIFSQPENINQTLDKPDVITNTLSSDSFKPQIKTEFQTSRSVTAMHPYVKMEKKESVNSPIHTSVHAIASPRPIKTEADEDQACRKNESTLPYQRCAACGKRALSACKKCAKIFFCSDACGLLVWNERHKEECGK